MKLLVLVDNNTLIDKYYLGEPGLSYYIVDGQEKILFDVGYSDVFMQNAQKMHIDLASVSTIVLSHGHDDHTRGLQYMCKAVDMSSMRLVAHPQAFMRKIKLGKDIGSPFSLTQLQGMCRVMPSTVPVKISEKITFLGEIPTLNDFEPRYSFGIVKDGDTEYTDLSMDDSALVYEGKEGLFIVTGCSHSGICNIIAYAKEVCADKRVQGVIGGFHLFDPSPKLDNTIAYFKKNGIKQVYPCHCVSFAAKAVLHAQIPIHEVGVSLEITVE